MEKSLACEAQMNTGVTGMASLLTAERANVAARMKDMTEQMQERACEFYERLLAGR